MCVDGPMEAALTVVGACSRGRERAFLMLVVEFYTHENVNDGGNEWFTHKAC